MADRIIFQSDEAELKDKEVLREQQKRGDDANMDSADSVSVILSAEGKTKYWEYSFTLFISVIKTMLFQRISLYEMLFATNQHPKPKPPPLPNNLEFAW